MKLEHGKKISTELGEVLLKGRNKDLVDNLAKKHNVQVKKIDDIIRRITNVTSSNESLVIDILSVIFENNAKETREITKHNRLIKRFQ